MHRTRHGARVRRDDHRAAATTGGQRSTSTADTGSITVAKGAAKVRVEQALRSPRHYALGYLRNARAGRRVPPTSSTTHVGPRDDRLAAAIRTMEINEREPVVEHLTARRPDRRDFIAWPPRHGDSSARRPGRRGVITELPGVHDPRSSGRHAELHRPSHAGAPPGYPHLRGVC